MMNGSRRERRKNLILSTIRQVFLPSTMRLWEEGATRPHVHRNLTLRSTSRTDRFFDNPIHEDDKCLDTPPPTRYWTG